jgi:L-ascorbate metabolism protein UlaG (beta-lactamase superfamily)
VRLTHFRHSCLLVEAGGARVLIDPGRFSPEFETVTGLDAVLITHQHVDHVDTDRLPALVAGNPDAAVLAEPSTVEMLGSAGVSARPLRVGDERRFAELGVRAVGGLHARLFEDAPRFGNIGLVLSAEGEPTLFHPGDSFYHNPSGVDVLALPLQAPWTSGRGTVEFLRAVGPAVAVPIHDGLLIPAAREIYVDIVRNFAPESARLLDLAGAGPTEIAV